MPNLFPGAIWRPIPVSTKRPYRTKGRAVVFHVAVSESDSLFNLFSSSPNDSHFYVRKDGTIEQYVDADLEAYASMAGNASTISVETQGGVINPDGEPWTDAQLQSLARIARWAHDTEGVPLQVMPDSKPASRGIGYHRLGIDPWRVPGGESWSSSRGKVCPGAAKIAQVPQIVALAGLNGEDMPLTDADGPLIRKWVWGGPGVPLDVVEGENPNGEYLETTLTSLAARVGRDQVQPRLDALEQRINAKIAALQAAPAGGAVVTQEQLEAALRKVLGSVDGS